MALESLLAAPSCGSSQAKHQCPARNYIGVPVGRDIIGACEAMPLIADGSRDADKYREGAAKYGR